MRTPGAPWVDVLLVNGPGTCVLVVAVSWIRRVNHCCCHIDEDTYPGVQSAHAHVYVQFLGLNYTRIIYVESFARVKSLSLSGKILRPFVDTFVVQWPDAGGEGKAAEEDANVRVIGPSRTVYKGWLV